MKVEIKDKRVIAYPETREEVAVVMQLAGVLGGAAAPEKKPRKYHKSTRRNVWKGKHAKPCPNCGKMFKNLKKHMNAARHNAPVSAPQPAPQGFPWQEQKTKI